MDNYNSDFRENNFIYLIRQSQELLEFAKVNKNSSALIYACLDSRIALEILDLHKILLSVNEEERLLILEDSKPKNGIYAVNRKIGILKEKYQMFYQAVCENLDVKDKHYDFKNSKDLQHKLSAYIHSYYMMDEDINFNSKIMQKAFVIISETHKFIKSSLHFDGEKYICYGIKIGTIPEEDKMILEEWKKSTKMEYKELKNKLKANLILRE
ncbi:hypothetical protein [Flavobacterium sp.]|uniref:hypothetical protein n=1 Tax=Flavobacterium sp. TaxID=239 RepID=UPI0025C448C3|nr:hypothetical protein [Flavobacterium sp.]MBA4276233.1 hypothetical protein [Flavobacterium sp.]